HGRADDLGRALVGGHRAEARGRRRVDGKAGERVALVGVGGLAAAADPGGYLIGGGGDGRGPGQRVSRAPVLQRRPHRAAIGVQPPLELIGRRAVGGGGGEGDGGAERLRCGLVGGHRNEARGRRR